MSDAVDYKIVQNSVLGVELNEKECEVFAKTMGVKKLATNEVLIKEGEPENTLFLLAKGRLSVTSDYEGNEMTMYTMSAGECAGTRSFIDGTVRKATLRAAEDCVVYTLEPKDFESLLDHEPKIVYKVMRALFRVTHSNLLRMNLESQELANYISKSGGRY